MPLNRPIESIGLEDVIAEGRGLNKSPEEIADAVQRWRSLTVDYGASKLLGTDADKFQAATAKLNLKTGEALAGLRTEAMLDSLRSAFPTAKQAAQAWDAYRAAGYRIDPETQGDMAPGLSVMDQLANADRWKAPSVNATMSQGIPFKLGDDTELPDGSVIPAPTLASYHLAKGSDGKPVAYLRITDPATGIPRDKKGYQFSLDSYSRQQLDDLAAQADRNAEAAARKAEEARAAYADAADTSLDPSGGMLYQDNLARRANEADKTRQQELFRAQQLRGAGGEAFAQHEALLEKIKAREDLRDQIGDESAWSRLLDTRGGFLTGLARALGPVARFGAGIRAGFGEEDAAAGLETAYYNMDAGRDQFSGLEAAQALTHPGNTRRQFQGGLWNDVVLSSQESIGQMIPALLIGGAIGKTAGLAPGTRLFEAAAVSPLAVSAAGNQYGSVLEQAAAMAKTDPERAARMRDNALVDAVLTGMVEGGTELIFPEFGGAIKRGPKGFVKHLGITGFKEGLEEIPAQGLENTLDNVLLGANKEITDGMATAFLAGGLAGTAMGGAGMVLHRKPAQNIPQNSPQTFPQQNATEAQTAPDLSRQRVAGAAGDGASPSGSTLTPATPTDPVGTVPETPESLAEQRRRVLSGHKPAMLFPGQAADQVPAALQPGEDDPFILTDTPAGAVLHPLDMDRQEIQQAAAEDRLGSVLGYGVDSKPDATGTPPVSVVQRNEAGVEIAAVAAVPTAAPAAAEALAAQTQPGDTVAIEHPAETVAKRIDPPSQTNTPAAGGQTVPQPQVPIEPPQNPIAPPAPPAQLSPSPVQAGQPLGGGRAQKSGSATLPGEAGRKPAKRKPSAAAPSGPPVPAAPPEVAALMAEYSKITGKQVQFTAKGQIRLFHGPKNDKPTNYDQKAGLTKMRRAIAGKKNSRGGTWPLPKNRTDIPDALDLFLAQFGEISNTGKDRTKTAEAEALKKLRKASVHLYANIVSANGNSDIDTAAQALHDAHPGIFPEATAHSLVDTLLDAYHRRRRGPSEKEKIEQWSRENALPPSMYEEAMAAEADMAAQNAAFRKANKPSKGDLKVEANQLDVGDFILINGVQLEVVKMLPGGKLMLQDGETFGTQVVDPAKELFLDEPPLVDGYLEKEMRPPASQREQQPAAQPAVSRSRPVDVIAFPNGGIQGPSGARIRSYQWMYDFQEDVDRDGEPIVRRVSNWDEAAQNFDTGRYVVHQFEVEMPDGTARTVSLETALELLGFSGKAKEGQGAARVKSMASAIKTLAKARMNLVVAEAALKEKQQWLDKFEQAKREAARMPLPERQLRVEGNEYFVTIGDFNAPTRFGPNWKAAAESGEWKTKWLEQDREDYLNHRARTVAGPSPHGALTTLSAEVDDLKRRIKRQEKKLLDAAKEQQQAAERQQQADPFREDFLAGQADDPFNLVPETAADIARREARQAREDARQEAEAEAQRLAQMEADQGKLFEPHDLLRYAASRGADIPNQPAALDAAAIAGIVRSDPAAFRKPYEQAELFTDSGEAGQQPDRKPERPRRRLDRTPENRRAAEGQRFRQLAAGKPQFTAEQPRITSVLADMVDGTIPAWNPVGKVVNSPEDFAHLCMVCRTPLFESVKIAVLNAKNEIMHAQILHVGSLAESVFGVRDVLRVIETARGLKGKGRVAGVIFSHNHPSGKVDPSKDDRAVTRQLEEALQTAKVPLVDHVITNGASYYSFKQQAELTLKTRTGAEWEAVPVEDRPSIGSDTEAARVAAMLRQDATAQQGHIIYLDTRLGIVAVERTELTRPSDIARHILQVAPGIGAAGILLDAAQVPAPALALRKIGDMLTQAGLKMVDASTPNVPSFKAQGVLEATSEDFIVREPDASYSTTPPVSPEYDVNRFGLRVKADERLRQSWRDRFTPAFYETFTERGLTQAVKGWIADNGGLPGATALFMDEASGLKDFERNALGQQLAIGWEQRAARQQKAGSQEGTDAAEAVLDQVIAKLEQLATQAGQALRSFGMWAKFSPRGIIRAVQRKAATSREEHLASQLGQAAQAIEQAVNAIDLTTATDEENELLRLWKLMKDSGPQDRGLAIAAALKLLMPQRIDYQGRIDANSVQAAFRQNMTEAGGNSLARRFFELMNAERPAPGPLAVFDQATNQALSELMHRAVTAAGLASEHTGSNQPTDIDKIVANLSRDPLRWQKIQQAAAQVEAQIDAMPDTRTIVKLVNGEEVRITVSREEIRAAWEEATRDMVGQIGGPSMLRRIIRRQLAGVKPQWKALFDLGKPLAEAVAPLRSKTVEAIAQTIARRVSPGLDLTAIRSELGRAFDEIAHEKFAAWLVQREAIARKEKQDAARKAFMAALRPQLQTQAATDRLDAIFATHVVGGITQQRQQDPLGSLIARHLREAVPDFLAQAQALGVPIDVAAEYDAAVQWHRQRAAERAKVKAQEQLIKQLAHKAAKTKANAELLPRFVKLLLQARENGAIYRRDFLDIYAQAFKLPRITPEFASELKTLAARVQVAPQGSWMRQQAVSALMARLALWEGVSVRNLVLAFWYANILSGIGTQLVNISGNAAHLLLKTITTLAAQPRQMANFIRGMVSGAVQGGESAWAAFWHGEPVLKGDEKFPRQDVLEVLWNSNPTDAFRRIARIGLASWGRYVFRSLTAADAFFYHTATEARAWLEAGRLAHKTGQSVQQILALDAQSIAAARADATAELAQVGIPVTPQHIDRRAFEILDSRRPAEIVAAARRFGGLVTFNYEPEGTLGAMVEMLNGFIRKVPIFRAVVPFTRIAGNLADQGLDWTGYGLVRGALGRHTFGDSPKFSRAERIERALAGAIGLSGSALLYAMARAHKDDDDASAPFMLYGGGPTDPNRRNQMPTGWRPYSIKIGDKYLSYAETPLSMVLAAWGTALDTERYGSKLDRGESGARVNAILSGSFKAFSRQGVLSSLDQFFGILEGRANPTGMAARSVSGFIPGQAFLRDIAKALDPEKVDTSTFAGILLQNLPVLRSKAGKVYNAFGDPVREPGPWLISRLVTSVNREDADALWLTRNGLHIPALGQDLAVGAYLTRGDIARAERRSPTGDERAALIAQLRNGYVTDEQRLRILLESGPVIRQAVRQLAAEHAARPMSPEKLASRLSAAVQAARRNAMANLIGLPVATTNATLRRVMATSRR